VEKRTKKVTEGGEKLIIIKRGGYVLIKLAQFLVWGRIHGKGYLGVQPQETLDPMVLHKPKRMFQSIWGSDSKEQMIEKRRVISTFKNCS